MIVLDAWAVLALLEDEPGAERVEKAMWFEDPVMSWINLGEVYYSTIRKHGLDDAEAAVRDVGANVRVETPDAGLVLAAGRIKAAGGLSYADAFALATAQRHSAPLITGDVEILRLESDVETVDPRAQS